MKAISKARLRDAEALAAAKRYEGAMHLCGYAVELGLKVRICKTLKWNGFPSTSKEFQGYSSFKTHNLDVLLHLTGMEDKIKSELFTEWSIVAVWDPESRYAPVGHVTIHNVMQMIRSTQNILLKL